MKGNGVSGRCAIIATRSAHRKAHARESRMAREWAPATARHHSACRAVACTPPWRDGPRATHGPKTNARELQELVRHPQKQVLSGGKGLRERLLAFHGQAPSAERRSRQRASAAARTSSRPASPAGTGRGRVGGVGSRLRRRGGGGRRDVRMVGGVQTRAATGRGDVARAATILEQPCPPAGHGRGCRRVNRHRCSGDLQTL